MAFASDTVYVLGGFFAFVFGTADTVTWDGPTSIVGGIEGGDITANDNSTVIVVGGFGPSNLARSTDGGASFSFDSFTTGDQSLATVSTGLGQFMAAGTDFNTGTGFVITSPGDGVWTRQTTPFVGGGIDQPRIDGSFFDSASSTMFIGGNKADDTGGISLSTDLTSWSAYKPNSFTTDGSGAAKIKDFASNGTGTLIAVGSIRVGGLPIAHAQRSIDGGNTWIDMTLNSFGSGGDIGSQINTATYGAGIFLVAGFDGAGKAHMEMSADDGLTWQNVDVTDFLPDSNSINDVKWATFLSIFVMATQNVDSGLATVPKTVTSLTGLAGSWTVKALSYPVGAGSMNAIGFGTTVVPPPPTPPPETTRLVRDPWDIDEWGRFYPGAGFHRIT